MTQFLYQIRHGEKFYCHLYFIYHKQPYTKRVQSTHLCRVFCIRTYYVIYVFHSSVQYFKNCHQNHYHDYHNPNCQRDNLNNYHALIIIIIIEAVLLRHLRRVRNRYTMSKPHKQLLCSICFNTYKFPWTLLMA